MDERRPVMLSRRSFLGGLALLLSCGEVAPPAAAPVEEDEPVTDRDTWPAQVKFGVNPHISIHATPEAYQALLTYLEGAVGVPFGLVVASNYEDLAQRLLDHAIDIGDLSPLNYVTTKQREPAVQLLVRQVATGSDTYCAYLVTRPETKLQDLHELRGRSVAFVDRLSASGYLFPVAAMIEAGLDPSKDLARVSFLGSHEAVARAVLLGEYEAGAVWSGGIDEMRAALPGVRQLRVIYKSERIPYDGYVARKGLPRSLVREMRRALLRLSTRSDEGRRALTPMPSQLNGFISAEDRDYDVIRDTLRVVQGARVP